MKARVISFFEVESRFRDLVVELDHSPMDEKLVLVNKAYMAFGAQ